VTKKAKNTLSRTYAKINLAAVQRQIQALTAANHPDDGQGRGHSQARHPSPTPRAHLDARQQVPFHHWHIPLSRLSCAEALAVRRVEESGYTANVPSSTTWYGTAV
jgi:hypothetical protein